jgi:hypothetical protein
MTLEQIMVHGWVTDGGALPISASNSTSAAAVGAWIALEEYVDLSVSCESGCLLLNYMVSFIPVSYLLHCLSRRLIHDFQSLQFCNLSEFWT